MTRAALLLLFLFALSACESSWSWEKPIAGQPGCWRSWHGTACYQAAQ